MPLIFLLTMRVLMVISLFALAGLLWASLAAAQHIRRARRRGRTSSGTGGEKVAGTQPAEPILSGKSPEGRLLPDAASQPTPAEQPIKEGSKPRPANQTLLASRQAPAEKKTSQPHPIVETESVHVH